MRAYERLLDYVKVYTTSDPESGTHPSAAREFDLAHKLVEELKALGVEEKVRSDSLHFKLVPNDRLLLCSDGLSDMLRDQEILDIMGGADLEKVADELLERSLSNGGRDNVSFIIIDMAEKAAAREAGLHG